jgi:hypothetical protein
MQSLRVGIAQLVVSLHLNIFFYLSCQRMANWQMIHVFHRGLVLLCPFNLNQYLEVCLHIDFVDKSLSWTSFYHSANDNKYSQKQWYGTLLRTSLLYNVDNFVKNNRIMISNSQVEPWKHLLCNHVFLSIVITSKSFCNYKTVRVTSDKSDTKNALD